MEHTAGRNLTLATMVWDYCRAFLRARIASERGASIVEYTFLVALIAVFCFGAMAFVGDSTAANLSESANKLPK